MPETISNFHGIEETLKDPPAGATLYASKKNARITALVELARRGAGRGHVSLHG